MDQRNRRRARRKRDTYRELKEAGLLPSQNGGLPPLLSQVYRGPDQTDSVFSFVGQQTTSSSHLYFRPDHTHSSGQDGMEEYLREHKHMLQQEGKTQVTDNQTDTDHDIVCTSKEDSDLTSPHGEGDKSP